jgi:predicted transposase YbfD/YdcC
VKGNQKELFEQIESRFNYQNPEMINEIIEKGHGRIETRKCEIITNLEHLDNRHNWEELKTIIKITATCETSKKTEIQTRYYISSLLDNAKDFNTHIRQHWGIENRLHWTLDMVFDEDRQRKRTKNSAQNFSFIRKIAINFLKSDNSKGSMVTKRLKAGWDNRFLLNLLKI